MLLNSGGCLLQQIQRKMQRIDVSLLEQLLEVQRARAQADTWPDARLAHGLARGSVQVIDREVFTYVQILHSRFIDKGLVQVVDLEESTFVLMLHSRFIDKMKKSRALDHDRCTCTPVFTDGTMKVVCSGRQQLSFVSLIGC